MSSHPVAVTVVGASGYTGAELLRHLAHHPHIELSAVYAHSKAGLALGEVFPALSHSELTLERFDAQHASERAQVAFLALPHGAAQGAANALRARGVTVIDLSADHRFNDPAQYADIYGAPHQHPERLKESVYGLPELFRDQLRSADLIACPGCYPTSVALGVSPAFKAGLTANYEVIADCKSGVSGAGRGAKELSLYAERAEAMQGYATLNHRHAPEMEATLGRIIAQRAGQGGYDQRARGEVKVHFSPHLTPMSRGILSTLYLRLKPGVEEREVREAYHSAYDDEPFVTLLPPGRHVTTLAVRGTNRCHLDLTVQGDMLVVHSAIDNLGKGAASQAIQCLNARLGLPETTGLQAIGMYP